MAAINRLTIMLIDSNRFFLDGMLVFIRSHYPDVIIKSSGRRVHKIDLLMTGLDRVSVSVARFYTPMLSHNGKVLLMHEADEVNRDAIPESLKPHSLIHMHKRQSLYEFAALIGRLVGAGGQRTVLTIIDKRSVDSSLLSPQEKLLVCQLRHNSSVSHIASEMKLHPKTISSYKRSVMLKLDMPHNLEFYHWLLYS